MIIIEQPNSGIDSVKSSITYTLPANVENLTLVGAANTNATGNDLDNVLIGSSGNNLLSGGAGNDTMSGGMGNDVLYAGTGDNTLDGGEGNDVLYSSLTGTDILTGGTGNDVYEIHNTNDKIVENPGGGNDTVWTDVSYTIADDVENLTLVGNINGTGNAGDNTIVVYGSGTHVIDGDAGNDTLIGGTGNDTLIGGAGNDALYGGDGNDIIRSSDGNNTLDGGAGNDVLFSSSNGIDTLTGGTGDDVYEIHNSADVIIETATGGKDTIWTDVSYTIADNVETMYLVGSINGFGNAGDNTIVGYGAGDNLIDGGAGNDTISAGAGNDTIYGGMGNDALYGSTGNDLLYAGTGDNTLDGGEGNDTFISSSNGIDTLTGGTDDDVYEIHNSADVIIETATGGKDTIWTDVSYTIADNVETMYLVGSVNGFGNAGDNTITVYGEGDNYIDGGAGNDTISAGAGNDTIYGGMGNDALYGSTGNDLLYAGTGDNTLDGGEGNDVLYSSNNGIDTLTGGTGDDVYEIHNTNDKIIETANGGNDTIWTDVSYTIADNVETMYLVGSVNGFGNAGDNTITVYGEGDNYIDGGAGNDTLSAGAGNDTISGGMGNDALYGSTGNDVLYAGTGDNTLDGGEGNDTLYSSKTGIDTLTGGIGDDVYEIHNTNDKIIENLGEGNDTVWTDVSYTLSANVETMYLVGSIYGVGNAGDNTIVGYGAGENLISAGAGNDTISGGAGNDLLYGGTGNDTFVFDSSSFLAQVISGFDTIGDFTVNQDKIQLSKAAFSALSTLGTTLTDYNPSNLTGDFSLVTNATEQSAAELTNAKIIYNSQTGGLFYNANGTATGFGTGGQFALLDPGLAISRSDFTLV
jgi:trimeric autotransporter adhesin